MANYKCKKCGRYVREEEQTASMKKKKLCVMCIIPYDLYGDAGVPKRRNMFGELI